MNRQLSSCSRLFEIAEYLIDDSTGIIRRVLEAPREAGSPDFFRFAAEACDTSAFTRQKNFVLTGGVSSDRNLAKAKAIGEAVERYCPALYNIDELPVTSFEAAGFPCIPPTEFALYSAEQYASPGFPYIPFDEKTLVRWFPAFDPLIGETRYVPAVTVLLSNFREGDRGEFPIAQSISTGLACHCSYEEAASSAICEVIERDAFTITWQARLAMPQINIETLGDHNRDLVQRFLRTGNDVTLFYLRMDHGVPVVLSASRCPAPDAPALAVAAAAHLDPEQAVRKSLEELAYTRAFAQQLMAVLPPFVPSEDFANVKTQNDHVHLYCDHRNLPLVQFLFESSREVDFREIENLAAADPSANLNVLLNRIRAVNHRVLLADVTSPDVREIGLWVVRAVIPGFHPLFMGHKIRALGGSRLWELPSKLGHAAITGETGDNPAPHPFP